MDLCWQYNVSAFEYAKLVITFLPRSKHLLISWLQLLSAVILEAKKIKSLTVSIVSLSICHEVMGPDAMILVFSKGSSGDLDSGIRPMSLVSCIGRWFLYH